MGKIVIALHKSKSHDGFPTERLFAPIHSGFMCSKHILCELDISDPSNMADLKVTAARGLGKSEQMTSFI